jgi:hypothetical protein
MRSCEGESAGGPDLIHTKPTLARAQIGWRAVSRLARILLLCLALTACEQSGDERYKEDYPPIDRGLVALGDDVGEGLRGADDATLAQRFAGYARRLQRLRDQLDELEPPGGVKSEHQRLLAAIGAVRGELAEVAEAARRGDAGAAGAAATRLVRDGARLDQERDRLAREVGG